MASSGCTVDDAAVQRFQLLQKKDKDFMKDRAFIVFQLDKDNKKVIVDDDAPCGGYEQLNEYLTQTCASEARYAVCNLENENKKERIVFMTWIPEGVAVKKKMIYASTSQTVKKSFNGIHKAVEVFEPSELEFEAIKEKAFEGTTI